MVHCREPLKISEGREMAVISGAKTDKTSCLSGGFSLDYSCVVVTGFLLASNIVTEHKHIKQH